MANILVDIPSPEYEQLQAEANRLGKTLPSLIQEWVTEKLTPLAPGSADSREKALAALSAAGLLSELSPELSKLADSNVPLSEVQEHLSRDKNETMSELVIKLREPKS